MAKLKMKRIELITPLEQSKDVVDFIQRQGVIELSDFENEELFKISTQLTISQFDKYIAVVQNAQDTLQKYTQKKSGLLSSLNGRKEISVSEYLRRSNEADAIISKCYEINSLAKSISDMRVSIARHETALDSLEQWMNSDVATGCKGTKLSSVFIGTLPGEYTREQLLTELAAGIPENDALDAEIIFNSKTRSCVFVICLKQVAEEVFEALRSIGFAYPSDPTRHPPSVRFERLSKEILRLNKEISRLEEAIRGYGKFFEDLNFALDYLTIRKDKYDALNKLGTSGAVLVLNGYIPEKQTEKLLKALNSRFTVAAEVFEPGEDEETPVLLENNAFASPVEGITEMYSVPGKDDVDPNPVMSFFYYFFFGIMLSDAGYGLIMTIAMIIAKTKFKLEGSMKRSVNMFLYCGISTVFWGAMFGSWFGDIIQVVAREFFGKEIGSLALWFEPVQDPMTMLLYSFLFGIIHLFVGLGVRFYNLCRHGKVLDAVCDVIPIYLLVTGVAPVGAGIIIDVPSAIKTAGTYMMLAGVVLVILTSGRSSKNIIGKLGGGLYGLYNVASGYLGDILSYSRLLALGLCTGVIATVINMLGTELVSNTVMKAVVLVFVCLFGHTLNIAINLIGAYVHTNRLQYVEFFSKFYEGGGRSFTPLKINTKHYKFKEEL